MPSRTCSPYRTPGPALQHTPARTRRNRYEGLLTNLLYTVASAAAVVLFILGIRDGSAVHLIAAGLITGVVFTTMCRDGLPKGYRHFGVGDD